MTSREQQPMSSSPPEQSSTQEEEQSEERSPVAQQEALGGESSTTHEHLQSHDISHYETQSSNVSDVTVQSRIPHPGGDERSESDPRTSLDPAESSESLTFPQHSRERISDDGGSSGLQSWSPPSPGEGRIPFQTEISTESEEQQQQQEVEESAASEVTIPGIVPDTPSKRTKYNPKKRRQFWQNLKRGGGNLRKRMCRCFSPKTSDQNSSDGEGFKIKPQLDLDEGIVRSDVTMDSITTREVEQVVSDHGGLIVLTGERLHTYQTRMQSMLEMYFNRQSGYEILRLWRMDAARPARLRVEMRPTGTTAPRILSLGDVRLLDPPFHNLRDDSLFRYFMSFEGLSQRMLVPGRA